MAADCKANEYCKVATCGATGGTCTAKPALTNVLSPVCGCDNVTYWNESVAAREFNVNTKAAGECPRQAATTVKCSLGNGQKCDGKRACNLLVPNALSCGGIVPATGTCWGLPPTCAAPNGKLTECNGDNCIGLCDAIKQEKPFYSDNSCN